MSQVYRAHSPAQAIEEAVVIAAALLAAVQAAPVPSTTPSRGIFKAEDAVRRKPWTTLAVIAFAALAGAVVFGGGGESRDHTLLVNAALSSARRRWWSQRLRGPPGRRPRPNASQRQTQRRRLSLSAQRTRPRPPVNPPPRPRIGERHRASVPPAMTGATSLTPTLPKRQRLRRRLRSLKLGMPQLQQRTRIVRSSSQTMSSCPITTNFVAFDEQQEVAVGAFAV